jgi:hypothetical protein
MKKLSVFGAFRFSEFRIRDCVPVSSSTIEVGGGFWVKVNQSRYTPWRRSGGEEV